MTVDDLLPPIRFRFTDPADVAEFGDRWWVWEEAAAWRLRARELISIEEAIGLPVRTAINLARSDTTRGNLSIMWIALRLAGREVAWADFNPLVLATEWEQVPEEPDPDPLDSGAAPPTADSSSPGTPTVESATS